MKTSDQMLWRFEEDDLDDLRLSLGDEAGSLPFVEIGGPSNETFDECLDGEGGAASSRAGCSGAGSSGAGSSIKGDLRPDVESDIVSQRLCCDIESPVMALTPLVRFLALCDGAVSTGCVASVVSSGPDGFSEAVRSSASGISVTCASSASASTGKGCSEESCSTAVSEAFSQQPRPQLCRCLLCSHQQQAPGQQHYRYSWQRVLQRRALLAALEQAFDPLRFLSRAGL
ncbi:hypothetical protein KCU65_g394, partial [Aureobasidium melanogenum]